MYNKQLKPYFENEISIIMPSDENYLPFLSTTVVSIIENASKNDKYSIYVLNTEINEKYQNRVKKLERKNLKITFIDVSKYIDLFDKNMFYLWGHFTIATYFRFFIPIIFKNFKKVIYCDSDAVFLDNPAKLYDIDLENKMLGAFSDIEIVYKDIDYIKNDYYTKTLKLKDPTNYFQAGLLILDVQKLIQENFYEKCINTLKRIKTPRYFDQDILNIICEDKVKFIDGYWNFENHLLVEKSSIHMLPPNIIKYLHNTKNIKFLHFTGLKKPWHHPFSPNAHLFWKYAIKSPFVINICLKPIFGRLLIFSKKFTLTYKILFNWR